MFRILQSDPAGATVFPLTQHVPSLCRFAPPFNAILHKYKGVVFLNSIITLLIVKEVEKYQVSHLSMLSPNLMANTQKETSALIFLNSRS